MQAEDIYTILERAKTKASEIMQAGGVKSYLAQKTVGNVPLGQNRVTLNQAIQQTAPTVAKDFGNLVAGRSSNYIPKSYQNTVGRYIGNFSEALASAPPSMVDRNKTPLQKGSDLMATAGAVKTATTGIPGIIASSLAPVLSTGIQAGVNMYDKQPVGQNLGQAWDQGQRFGYQTNALVSGTNPIINKVWTKANLPNAGIASRVGSAGANVGQGVLIDKSLGLDTTPGSMALDAVLGFAGGSKQFGEPVVKNIQKGADAYSQMTPAQRQAGFVDPTAKVNPAPKPPTDPLEAKNLIAQHNIKPQGVLHADKMGGLPLPSLAISKKQHPMEGFGDISLLADKNLYDPSIKSNKVYNSDFYSPRYPSVNYGVDRKVAEDVLEPVFKDVVGYYKDPHYSPSYLDSSYSRAKAMLEARGFDDQGREALENDFLLQGYFAKQKGAKPDDDVVQVKKIVDDNQPEYQDFIDDLFQQLNPSEKMFRGYTYSGNRKYIPHTLDNVVKVMKSEMKTGEAFLYGVGSIRSKVSKKYSNLKQIKADENKIISSEKFQELKSKYDNQWSDFIEKGTNGYSVGDSRSFTEAVIDGIKRGNIEAELKEYGYNIKIVPQLQEFLKELKEAPTEYFEVKPQRRVGLDEFMVAVVPSDTPKNVINALESNGIKIYKHGANDRAKVIARAAEENELAFGAIAGIEPYQDEDGNWKTRFNPEKALAGMAMVGGVKAVKGKLKLNQSQLPKSGVNPSTLGVTPPNLKQLNQPKLPDELQLPPSVKPKIAAKKVIGQEPIINTKRDIPIKDVFGNKAVLPAGEAYTPHLTSDNKIILKDGEQFLVNKSTYDNVKGQSVKSEAKPFAPELEGLEESVMGGINDNYRTKLSDMKSELSNILNMRGRTDKQLKRASQLTKEIDRLEKMDSAKYSQYTLPGGENYREILIKAPRDMSSVKDITAPDGRVIKGVPSGTSGFKSSHWDEPNVISHIRMNDRYLNNIKFVGEDSRWFNFIINGKEEGVSKSMFNSVEDAQKHLSEVHGSGQKVAFMEELQSDWAREGRDKGFIDDKPINYSVREDENVWVVKTDDGRAFDVSKTKVSNKDDVIKYVKDNNIDPTFRTSAAKVPNHPLLKNWQEPTIKRALKDAVDNDAEYFAWINGDQTSARYNLATVVNDIDWHPQGKLKIANVNTKGAGKLELMLKDGEILEVGGDAKAVTQAQNWKGKKLDEVLGKGLADKIMGEETGTLSGEGLKFGGEWANNLYDKQVKSIVEKLTGGKVEVIDLGMNISKKGYTTDLVFGTKNKVTGRLDDITNYNQIKLNQEIYHKGKYWLVTKLLGDGKFEAVDIEKLTPNGNIRANAVKEIFDLDIKPKSPGQQAIRLTPEIKARIRGEAPPIKQPSGKTPDLIKAFSGKSTQAKGMGSNIGTKEFSYTPATNLSKEHQAIESKFGNYLKNNLKKAETIYREKFGNVINTDNARELSADYVKDKERLSAAVHEPASSFVKSLYSDMLHEPVSPGKNKTVLMLSGGTGAGKTSAIRDLGLGETAQIIYDSNMSRLDSTVKKIEQALDNGFRVDFNLVLRDPIDSFTNGAVPRAVRMGRTVPLEQHVQTHVGSLDVFKKLKDKYSRNKNVRFRVIENNSGKNNASLRPLDFIDDIVYNKQDISNSVKNELERLYANGTITRNHHEGFTGYTGI